METKHEKFQRLAESRTNRAIDSVRSLAKLANKNHYEFRHEEVQAIFTALKTEIDAAKAAYATVSVREEKQRFKLTAKKAK